jgi:hypothetical protein
VFEQTGTVLPEARMERTLRKLDHLQKKAVRYRSLDHRIDVTGETQVSLTGPDARSMATTAQMPRISGYTVQTAVEADNHLIFAHEVTMPGFDCDALSMMAAASNGLTAIADKGDFNGEGAGISVVVPKPMTSSAAPRGHFEMADFAYERDLESVSARQART